VVTPFRLREGVLNPFPIVMVWQLARKRRLLKRSFLGLCTFRDLMHWQRASAIKASDGRITPPRAEGLDRRSLEAWILDP
jgi:hypothetical protein